MPTWAGLARELNAGINFAEPSYTIT